MVHRFSMNKIMLYITLNWPQSGFALHPGLHLSCSLIITRQKDESFAEAIATLFLARRRMSSVNCSNVVYLTFSKLKMSRIRPST